MINELKVFLVAMSPLVELRGAIPLALGLYHLPLWSAYLLAVTGNFIPLALIVLLAKPLTDFLSQKSWLLKSFLDWLFERVRHKTVQLGRFGRFLTVVILTAIPIPLVGGWTGAVAAFLLELPLKRALPALGLGVTISGLIVSCLSLNLLP
jgi:uncharacterized membrane protein